MRKLHISNPLKGRIHVPRKLRRPAVKARRLWRAAAVRVTPVMKFICAPLREMLPRFTILFILNISVLVAGMWLYPFEDYTDKGMDEYFQGTITTAFTLSYVIMLIVRALQTKRKWPRVIGSVWYWLCFSLIALSSLIDAGCFGFLDRPFDHSFVILLAGTNFNESQEFLESYFRWDAVWYALYGAGVTIVFWLLAKWATRKGRRLTCWIAFPWIVINAWWCTDFCCNLKDDHSETGLGVIYKIYSICGLEPAPAIEPANPKLEETRPDHPQNIVVIIGESMARTHCSTMGYDHETQPLIQARIDRGEGYAYDHVTAAYIYTIECFKRFMSTFRYYSDKRHWWQAPNLIEVARLNGYHTIWISNQDKVGMYDNPIARFAQFADEAHFAREDILRKDDKVRAFDEVLFPIIAAQKPAESSERRVYFIHLYGSHAHYHYRYPDAFKHFKPSDYPERPSNQRAKVSYYDNSIRYNDYVVDSIVNMFRDTESVIFYFPDHGQDIYRTNPNQAGHAKNTEESSRVGREIPFYIFTTEAYRKRFPYMLPMFEKALHRDMCTTEFIYTYMDVMGTRFVEEEYAHPDFSLFYEAETEVNTSE